MTPARRRVLEGVVATLGLYMQRVEYDDGVKLSALADKIVRIGHALRARGRENAGLPAGWVGVRWMKPRK